MKKIAILGAGSWGTALSVVLNDNGHQVEIWDIDTENINYMKSHHVNRKYLPNVTLPDTIGFELELDQVVKDVDVILLAIPSQAVRSVLSNLSDLPKEIVFVNVAKGIEISSLKRISEIVKEFYPNNRFAALSGPSHAEEVSEKMPTTLVSASKDRVVAEMIQDLFLTKYLRVYTNPDVVGVEVAGALKNIIALGAGISDGLGFGDNAKAALITRGIKEIARLGKAMGADAVTFDGLTGIGDLIVTCTSMHSRNRRCGILIGKGKSLEEAKDEIGMVVEGAFTAKSAYELSVKYEVEMPITNQLYKVLYEGYNPYEAVSNLMKRSKKHEMEDVAKWS